MPRAISKKQRSSVAQNLMYNLAAVACVIVWGMSFVSTKVLLENNLGPVEIYLYRFILAYVIVCLFSHKRLFAYNFRDEMMFVLVGLSGGSLYFIAENIALQYTLTTNVSLLTGTSPLLTTLLVGLLYKNERPKANVILGSLIAILGVGCTIFNTSFNIEVNPLGDLLALGASLLWAIYALILKPLNVNYDVWFITRKTFFYGVVTALPFLLLQEGTVPFSTILQTNVLLNLLFLGLGASLAAYLLWAYCVKGLGPVKGSNYMYFQPIVTMVASVFILSEPISFVGVLGIVLILAGVWISDWLKMKKTNLVTAS